MSVMFNVSVCVIYMGIYFMLVSMMFASFQSSGKYELVKGVKGEPLSNTHMYILILTTAGIPPFSMFFMKIIVLLNLLSNPAVAVLAIGGTVMTTFFYLTIIIPNAVKVWVSDRHKVKESVRSTVAVMLISLFAPILTWL